jgi:hypothetical protein
MSSTVKRVQAATVATAKRIKAAGISTAKRSAFEAGRQLLPRILNYYKFNTNEKRNLLIAYNKYRNALSNSNAINARRNAQIAGTKFTNAVFKVLNKASARPGPVSNGLQNGVQRSIIYWLPGIFVRRTFRFKPKSVPRRPTSI